MSGEVPIELEDKPTAVDIMRELVERLQDTIEALKREIVRPRCYGARITDDATDLRLDVLGNSRKIDGLSRGASSSPPL